MGMTADKKILVAVTTAYLYSCTAVEAPVDSRETDSAYRAATVTNYYEPEAVDKGYHLVAGGDTLYSISWRYGLDYRDVARWNNISVPYTIRPGQRLRLIPDPRNNQLVLLPPEMEETPVAGTSTVVTTPTVENPPVFVNVEPENTQSETPKAVVTTGTATRQGPINWKWPTQGNLIRSNNPIAQKGLDISGNEGQDIMAAADGVVVYSGSGLLGYGKLIIIKHDDTYLSAYAHNQIIRVNEGERVSGGQKIATMGRGNRGEPLLHFEIRRDGKPVDPIRYLPARS
jgi:lipoprotein NlpD